MFHVNDDTIIDLNSIARKHGRFTDFVLGISNVENTRAEKLKPMVRVLRPPVGLHLKADTHTVCRNKPKQL